MRQFTLIIVLGAFLTARTPTSLADDPPKTPQTRPAATDGALGLLSRLRQAAGDLKITDEQKKQLGGLLDKAGGDLKATAEKFKDDAQARAREAQDVFDRLRQDIGGVLSPEQRRELQRKLESAIGGSAGVLELLREQIQKLDLTDAQKKQVEQIMTDARTKFTDLRDQARAGSQEAREKILDQYSETRKKLEDVLNADQKRQLQESLTPRSQPAKDK